MATRTQQLAELNERTDGLNDDRIGAFKSEARQAYDSSSIVDRVTTITDAPDPLPDDYPLLSIAVSDSIRRFNDPTVHWDMFHRNFGRAIAFGEQRKLFETLVGFGATVEPTVTAADPQFTSVMAAISDLRANGFNPDVVCVPAGLAFPFELLLQEFINWTDEPLKSLVTPAGSSLAMLIPSDEATLADFIVYDSQAIEWQVAHVDGSRLRLGIGTPPLSTLSVQWVVETAARADVVDADGIRRITVEGEPLRINQYVQLFEENNNG